MRYLLQNRLGEAICLVLLLATGLALLIGAASLPAPMFDPLGPAGLPRYIAYLLLAFLAVRVVVLIREIASTTDRESIDPPNLLGAGERGIPRAENVDAPQIVRLGLVAVITLGYVTALTVGGIPFTWLTLAYLAAVGAAMAGFTPRKLAIVAGIAVIMSFALTFVFTDVLSVVLPE